METDFNSIDYQTSGAQHVLLTVRVGNAQIGGSAAFIDGQLVTKSEQIEEHDLGSGTSLAGKTLRVITVVTDANPATDKLVVTQKLTGGITSYEEIREVEVQSEGAARFTFVATFA